MTSLVKIGIAILQQMPVLLLMMVNPSFVYEKEKKRSLHFVLFTSQDNVISECATVPQQDSQNSYQSAKTSTCTKTSMKSLSEGS